MKKKNEHTSGWRIFAYHVPHILLFPKHLLPSDKTFSFIWKTSLSAKFVLGTMAGTTVLYTQYPARVTICEVTQEIYMTEIQLRRIVDRNAMEGVDQQSDGDERMVKDGLNISKFSKEAMTLGDDVYTCTGKESEIYIAEGLCFVRPLCGRRQGIPHQKRSA